MPTVSVINCGIGNLRSIKIGLEKVGANVLITQNIREIDESDAVVLPGVGAFAPAMKNLQPLTDTLKKKIDTGEFLFGIGIRSEWERGAHHRGVGAGRKFRPLTTRLY